MENTRGPLRITYIGHSTVLIDVGGLRVLTDPILINRIGPVTRHAASADMRLVKQVDIVLLSHLHADHFNATSLRRVDDRARLVVPRGAAAYLRERIGRQITELEPGEVFESGGVSIRATDAQHDILGQPLGVRSPTVGYLIDTDIFPGMADIRDASGGCIDVALLPISGWGLRVPAGHLNPQRAAESLELLRPAHVVPIHWGSFRLMGTRRIQHRLYPHPAREFVDRAQVVAPDVDVRVVKPGESTTFG
jgi:L-ascorbate metabolism protein UlaG (beta-lactamase superfamily)